ncbi:MAG: hypothetical protein CMB64_04685 [Euryarchaeota archaeon]|nr:hypothetical protein [Euryarchaeota archaeon]
MFIDHSFDVCSAAESVANLTTNQILSCDKISSLFPNSCLFSFDELGDLDICEEDIQQGNIGDCWLLSSLACIARKCPSFLKNMVIYDNKVEGRSVLRIANRNVEVDHMIPIKMKNSVVMDWIGPRLSRSNEYWPLIFEKALIKYIYNSTCDIKHFTTMRRISKNVSLFGYNYCDIDGGFPRWVFNILFDVNLQPIPTNISINFIEIFSRSDCLACACTSSEYTDDHLSEGFVYGHAYSIIGASKENGLIRVRNPWGKYESTEFDDGQDDGSFWVSEIKFREKFKVCCFLYVTN